jgi:hypothetical protein
MKNRCHLYEQGLILQIRIQPTCTEVEEESNQKTLTMEKQCQNGRKFSKNKAEQYLVQVLQRPTSIVIRTEKI